MKGLNDIKAVYFIGVGGIGMSAIARFFNARGVEVYGYDRTPTTLTQQLEAEGIHITYDDAPSQVQEGVDLVIYTPAIPQDNTIFKAYQSSGIEMLKRADVLQWITDSLETIAVAGTHGKTTTSTMIAYLMREAGPGCNAFLGGIAVNYNANFWSSSTDIAVVEADEYDRSFLKLSPSVAVLTAIDPDHLDIYGTAAECENAFVEFTHKIRPNGVLIHKQGLRRVKDMGGDQKIAYSLQNDLAQSYASNIVMKQGGYTFDVINKEWILKDVYLPIGGMHNVENCVAAITVAKHYFVEDQAIRDALANFKGIKRRFEYVIKNDKVVYIDDYAHHPEELKALIKSAKTLFPKRRCVVVFQPHLYSRTRDFATEFAQVLDMADEVILLDIYPARELPMEGVSSQMIADRMGNPNVTVLTKEGLIAYAQNAPLELFITAGAGDIDKIVPALKEAIEHKL